MQDKVGVEAAVAVAVVVEVESDTSTLVPSPSNATGCAELDAAVSINFCHFTSSRLATCNSSASKVAVVSFLTSFPNLQSESVSSVNGNLSNV